jgi:nucleotide-binding universal stress UspA family protein
MTYKSILLYFSADPRSSGAALTSNAIALAMRLGARIQVHIVSPVVYRPSHWALGGSINAMASGIERESAEIAARFVEDFEAAARLASIPVSITKDSFKGYEIGPFLAAEARLHDIVVGQLCEGDEHRDAIETIIFQSGRPMLVFPSPSKSAAAPAVPTKFDVIAVAWDGSRLATRALNDALPLLKLAKRVDILSVVDDKDLSALPRANGICGHLERYGVAATSVDVQGGKRPIAEVLEQETQRLGADLLVMGAYGHARAREFWLGGATKGLLDSPPLPLMLSH